MKAFTFSIAAALTCLTAQAKDEGAPTQATAMSAAANALLEALEDRVGTVQADQRELATWGSTPIYRYTLTTKDGLTVTSGTKEFDLAWKGLAGMQGLAGPIARELASRKGYFATETIVALADMAAVSRPHQMLGGAEADSQLTYYVGRAIEVSHAWRLFSLLDQRMPTKAKYTSTGYVNEFASALATLNEHDLTMARYASEMSATEVALLNVTYEKGVTKWAIPGLSVKESGDPAMLEVSLTADNLGHIVYENKIVTIEN